MSSNEKAINEIELFKEELDNFINKAKETRFNLAQNEDINDNIKDESSNEIENNSNLETMELDNIVELEDDTLETKELNELVKDEITNDDTIDIMITHFDDKKEESNQENSSRKEQVGIKAKGKRMMLLSLLFIPAFVVLFFIGSHSSELIKLPIFFIVTFVMVSSIMLFFYGLYIFVANVKEKSKKTLKKWLRVTLIVFYSLYIIGCSTFLVLLYGPSKKFKDWLVTTAMSTMNHQYLCKWFYSDADIKEVQSRNYILEPENDTDPSLINKDNDPVVLNEYEKEIMTHEENEKYKIVTFEVNGAKAYIAAIYDPNMVRVEVTNQIGRVGEYVTNMAARNNAILAINGGGFVDAGGNLGESPTGITIVNGKIITDNEYGEAVSSGGLIGLNKDGVLVLAKVENGQAALDMGIRDAVSWGPFLIVNGESAKVTGNGGWGGGARTAIGQRKDGTILFLVVDSNASRTNGAGMEDLVEIMERYGAYNAANLDGGTSSVIAVPTELAKSKYNAPCTDYFTKVFCEINDPIDATGTHQTRYVATSFIVVE